MSFSYFFRSHSNVAKMAAEVNPGQYNPTGEEKPCSGHKSSRKVRAAGGRTRSVEPVKHEEEYEVRTSVLQGKVKALKEKHMKQRKESRVLEGEGGEENNNEDALVSPQLRTYLTEELLDITKHSRYSDAHQQRWSDDEFSWKYSSDGSSVAHSNGCKIVNSSNHKQNTENNSSSDDLGMPENTTERDSVSLSLAERVERNRQELRSKFGKGTGDGEEITHSRALSQGQPGKSCE